MNRGSWLRKKETIETVSLAFISALVPKNFSWKVENQRYIIGKVTSERDSHNLPSSICSFCNLLLFPTRLPSPRALDLVRAPLVLPQPALGHVPVAAHRALEGLFSRVIPEEDKGDNWWKNICLNYSPSQLLWH